MAKMRKELFQDAIRKAIDEIANVVVLYNGVEEYEVFETPGAEGLSRAANDIYARGSHVNYGHNGAVVGLFIPLIEIKGMDIDG